MTATASTLAIREYRTSDDAAIARLNQRFRAAGVEHVQYSGSSADATPIGQHRERLFVVADGDEIRGGAFLREVPIAIGDQLATVGWVKYPLAESQIDRAFSGVPAALLLQLMREQPQLAALGMGGYIGVFAQLLSRLKWQGSIVPTFLCPLRPHVVASALPHLQRSARLRRIAAAVRWSGLGYVGALAMPPVLRARNRSLMRHTALATVGEYSTAIDALWAEARGAYAAIGVRDLEAAPWRSPAGAPGLQRFEIRRSGALIGWFALQIVDLRRFGAAASYGPLTLGVIHDCLALPADAPAVAAWALEAMVAQGVDLAIANHSHPDWQHALRRVGFLNGPETFAFYRAPAMQRAFSSQGVDSSQLYLTRSDDGHLAF